MNSGYTKHSNNKFIILEGLDGSGNIYYFANNNETTSDL